MISSASDLIPPTPPTLDKTDSLTCIKATTVAFSNAFHTGSKSTVKTLKDKESGPRHNVSNQYFNLHFRKLNA